MQKNSCLIAGIQEKTLRSELKLLLVTAFAAFFVFSTPFTSSTFTEEKHRRILFISSYHPGFPTFNQQVAGIKSVFNSRNDIIDMEFMDTKRFPQKENILQFHRMLSWKLKKIPGYHSVIAADDAALNYVMSEESGLFSGIPLFFCGINDIDYAIKLNKGGRVRGIIEAVSAEETLELILKLFPERKNLVIITDSTSTGQADLKTTLAAGSRLPFNYSVLSLKDISFTELHESVSVLGDNSAILLLAAYTDVSGETRLFRDELENIISISRVPVFHFWEHGLGDGIIGGKLISHEEQGRAAAEIAIEFLNGKPIDKLVIDEKSPNSYKFDYEVLKKFGVPLSSLPEQSIVINRPVSFHEAHRTAVITASLAIALLCFSVIALLIHKRQLQRQISERTSELKERELQLKMALDNAQQITWEWDAATNMITVSRVFEPESESADSGASFEWKDFLKKFHPDDLASTISLLTSHMKGETPLYENIHRRVLSDGSVKWLLARGKVTERGADGRALKMIGISIDITYIKKIEDELRNSRQMLRLVLDTIPIGVFWKDARHEYRGCNNVFAKEMGLGSPDDIVGKTDRDLMYSSQAESFTETDSLVFESGKPLLNYEQSHTLPSGNQLILKKSKVPLTDEYGSVIGVLGTYEDITEQKKMAEEIQKMQRLESVGILAAGIAHDFNNILMGLSGTLTILGLSDGLTDRERKWLEKAESLCLSATDLTSRLITFSKGGKPVCTDVNIEDILNEAANQIPENSGISLEIKTDNLNRNHFLDERQMKQVVRNIVINSVEAMPSGGVITIHSSDSEPDPENSLNLEPGRYLKITFSDTGAGIKPEDLDRIFDPYFSTKNMGAVKGQGLGLTICRSIIKNHDGAITVSSFPGSGTTITVYIPTGARKQ